jgi:glycolate oxidase
MTFDALIDEFIKVVGADGVLAEPGELLAYECDGFPIAKGVPAAVVLPTDTVQVSECVKLLSRHNLPIVPRGSGTGLTGGCVAFDRGAILCTARMTRIEHIDLHNRYAVVQAGVRNSDLSDAVVLAQQRAGGSVGASLHFSPNPSSQGVSTIGGNAATNAGGINTLKYGVTTHHILGVEWVLADGSIVVTRPGGLCDGIGPDLPGLLCGSEGTLAIITRLWCRLTPQPIDLRTVYAVFDSTDRACQSVGDIIASGIVPAAMEMIDGLMIQVVEDAFHYGFPKQAAALLLIEIDGPTHVVDLHLGRVLQVCRTNHATDLQHCSDPARRAELWHARKHAFGAIGRISRSYCTQDACIPPSRLPEALREIKKIGERSGLTIPNVFHAGDGNIHPILLFDEDNPRDVRRVLQASLEILEYCVGIGGTITGEHGVGVEKLHLMSRMFNPATLDCFSRIKSGFDPARRMNDGKLIPSDRIQIELLHPVGANSPGGAL